MAYKFLMFEKKNHQSFKRPESVLVVVYTAAGEFLLMERKQPRGFWQSVTGSLEWDESATVAARRELQEETGLDLEPVNLRHENCFPILPAWRSRYHPDVKENREHVFAVKLPTICDIQMNPDEHIYYEWLDAISAMSRCGSWINRDAIELISKSLNFQDGSGNS